MKVFWFFFSKKNMRPYLTSPALTLIKNSAIFFINPARY